MPTLVLATLTLEGFPMPDGRIRVVLHSQAGQQELFVTLTEWSRLARIDATLDAAGRLLTEVQGQRDRAVADVERLDELHCAEIRRLDLELAKARTELRDLRAKQAAFVEAASHG